ncbi:MAG: hypothetical protein M0R48_03975 [Candidatus Omnitrophica bacterium]|jgi:hypothetical protein|nr:hypothetical protein [Candidatus Omnitrophota bacterium]
MKFIIFSMITFFLMACEPVHKAAQEVGKPVGAATKAVGGVTEGAAEGYSDKQTENPYNR